MDVSNLFVFFSVGPGGGRRKQGGVWGTGGSGILLKVERGMDQLGRSLSEDDEEGRIEPGRVCVCV